MKTTIERIETAIAHASTNSVGEYEAGAELMAAAGEALGADDFDDRAKEAQ